MSPEERAEIERQMRDHYGRGVRRMRAAVIVMAIALALALLGAALGRLYVMGATP